MRKKEILEIVSYLIKDELEKTHSKLSYDDSYEMNAKVSDALHLMGYCIGNNLSNILDKQKDQIEAWLVQRQYEELNKTGNEKAKAFSY